MLELKTKSDDKSNNKFKKGTTIPTQSMIRRFIIEINRKSTEGCYLVTSFFLSFVSLDFSSISSQKTQA